MDTKSLAIILLIFATIHVSNGCVDNVEKNFGTEPKTKEDLCEGKENCDKTFELLDLNLDGSITCQEASVAVVIMKHYKDKSDEGWSLCIREFYATKIDNCADLHPKHVKELLDCIDPEEVTNKKVLEFFDMSNEKADGQFSCEESINGIDKKLETMIELDNYYGDEHITHEPHRGQAND